MAVRRNVWSLVLVALVAGAASPCLEARMIYRFEPSLTITLLHDGDVFGSTFEEELSDELAQLRAILPLAAESERSALTVLYAPAVSYYSTYDDLNRVNHQAELLFTRSFSLRNSWEVGAAYLDTSDNYNDLLDDELIVAPRDRLLLTANTEFVAGVSERVDLTFTYHIRNLEYPDSDIGGYTSHLAGMLNRYAVGARSDVGLDYVYQWFAYEEGGDFRIHNILGTYTVRPTAETSLDLAGGGYFQDYTPEAGAGEPAEDGERDVGFIGEILWSWQGRRMYFETGMDRQVRATGGFSHSLLAHSLHLTLSGAASQKVHLALTGLLRRNEPTIGDRLDTVDILRAGFELDYRLTNHLDVGFFADYIVQESEDPLRRDLSYPRVGIHVNFGVGRERDNE